MDQEHYIQETMQELKGQIDTKRKDEKNMLEQLDDEETQKIILEKMNKKFKEQLKTDKTLINVQKNLHKLLMLGQKGEAKKYLKE